MIYTTLFEKTEILLEARVTARVITPSGIERKIDSIAITDIKFSYDADGYESVTPGEEQNVLRLFPDEIGTYTIDYGNKIEQIEVLAGTNKGFIEVSKADPRYFAFSDGSSFVPLGINLAFPSVYLTENGFRYKGMRQYEHWFKECSRYGVKMARVWLGHEYFCPDTEQVQVYNNTNLTKIDLLLDIARKYGIKLKFVLEQFRYFNYERKADGDSYDDDVFRKFNKKIYAGTRRCDSASEWLNESIWQEAWLKKVSMLAERISGDPAVFAIELWNEFNCLPRNGRKAWNEKMLNEVKMLFPKHLVTNSFGSLDSPREIENYENFGWEKSEIKELHRYLDIGAQLEVCHDSVIDLLRDGFELVKDATKPTVVSESGAVEACHSGPFRYYSDDTNGILFCDAVYTPLFLGFADCGNIWHWDARYVDAHGHFKLFEPLSLLCKDIEFDKEEFHGEVIEDNTTVLLLLRGKSISIGYLRNKNATWQNLLRDKKEVLPISDKEVELKGFRNLSVIDIHKDDKNSIDLENGKLKIKHLDFGALLRFE